MNIHILGIRHHGAGSARYVQDALQHIKPDCVLIEGPPDADGIIAQATAAITPPVAILVYNQDLPNQASFYPYAVFSPEWVAVRYALDNGIKARFMDLPLSLVYAENIKEKAAVLKPNEPPQTPDSAENTTTTTCVPETVSEKNDDSYSWFANDYPMDNLAQIGGYDNTDLWWEHHFEQHNKATGFECHFKAVDTAMEALREAFNDTPYNDTHNQQREAYMRRIIRETAAEMYTNIVIICGAWHAPMLASYNDKKQEKTDNELLKKLPKPVKTEATWTPWTYSRLSMKSGYGAGIVSPGWFEHLWDNPTDNLGHYWLSRVARLFRSKNMDISTAHIIEAARLATALAAMRNLSRPGLYELNEAAQTVICFGDAALMRLIEKELIVSEKMGKVPDNLPKPPIQVDFEKKIKSLRLTLSENKKELVLDLRNSTDLARSQFLFTLCILDIPLAQIAYDNSKGTFKELWTLHRKPELTIKLIEMGLWGNTVEDAAVAYVKQCSSDAQAVSQVSQLIAQAIPAALYEAIHFLKHRLDDLAAVGSDIQDLLASLLPLVSITRYGDVRRTDANSLLQVIEKIIMRICVGLVPACYSLDDKSAAKMFKHICTANEAVFLLENDNLSKNWYGTLSVLSDNEAVSPLVGGCAVRLMFDAHKLNDAETAMRFGKALSVGNSPDYTAAWLEGFLKDSGELILYDNVLWHILHKWLSELPAENFAEQLPILRRTFAKFEVAQRRMIGEKARETVMGSAGNTIAGTTAPPSATVADTFNARAAEQVLDIVWQILAE